MIENSIYLIMIYTLYFYFIQNQYKTSKTRLKLLILMMGIITLFSLSMLDLPFSMLVMILFIGMYLFLIVDQPIKNNERLFILGLISITCLLFIGLNNLYNFKLSIIITYNISVLIVFMMSSYYKKQGTTTYYFIFFGMIILLSYISIVYVPIYVNFVLVTLTLLLAVHNQSYMRKTYEQEVAEYQAKMIKQQVDEVENIYDTMRGWRHDFHNHLQTLKAHLAFKRYPLMNQYLNELENDLNDIKTLVQSNNTNLDAILNSKLSLAMIKQIDITVKASVPRKLAINDIDLCVIIGNLLDNAIESCESMIEDDHRFIRIYIGLFKKQLYISVTNSTKEVIRKLDREYVTNKRGNHGHGLKRIDNVVKKYDGYVNRKNEPGVFVTEIMLPL